MTSRIRVAAYGIAAIWSMYGIAAASAGGNVPARTVTVGRVAAAAVPSAPHRRFGALVGVSGHLLILQLRNGQLLHVDADSAFAQKRVSAPFYRGKPTVVDGFVGAGGVFYATAVRRAAPSALHWGVDR